MSLSVLGIIIDSVLLIILIALQGKNSEDISSAILGGDRDLDLFKEVKERGIDLFLTRATTICTVIFFVLLGVVMWQGGTV
jgi:preprotein translocase subunit SecG